MLGEKCMNSETLTVNYAFYILNSNKHGAKEKKKEESNLPTNKTQEFEESNICVSLLGTNLDAEQATIVRSHLIKTFFVCGSADFENEGKLVTLKFSDNSKSFGCYYHHLMKEVESPNDTKDNAEAAAKKKVSFFLCLLGPSEEIMESFHSELGIFCQSMIPLLDPEGKDDQKCVQQKLECWYVHCVEYISRCIELFNHTLVSIFQSALHGKTVIKCSDESIMWDLERFCEACSLYPLLQVASLCDMTELPSSVSAQDVENTICLEVCDGQIKCDKDLTHASYCEKWVEKLLICDAKDDPATARDILENFRLKTVQDLNLLKRLLKKAELDYYSLFRAYQFLMSSGYEGILLYHARREALLSANEDVLDVIACLDDYIRTNKSNE